MGSELERRREVGGRIVELKQGKNRGAQII